MSKSLEKSVTLIGLVAGLSFILSTSLTKYFNSNSQDKTQIEQQRYINSIEQQFFSLQIVKELKNDSSFSESRGYENASEEQLKRHFTAGTLRGKGKLVVRPLVFFSEEKKESVVVFHVGDYLCGHPGIVHGIQNGKFSTKYEYYIYVFIYLVYLFCFF